MFGVIICGRCQRPRGVDLSTSRARCPHCGAAIDVRKARVFYRTDSRTELARAVRAYTESRVDIEDPLPAPRPRREEDPYALIASAAEGIGDGEERLRYLARELSALHDPFTEEDLGQVVSDSGVTLARMLSLGLVYEPSPGRYRPL